MAGKKDPVQIPEEYQNREYPYEQWIKDVIAAAVQKQSTRNEGVYKPDWWREDVNGNFENCIGTATDSYGVKPSYGNGSWLNSKSEEYYGNKGFRMLGADEEGQDGDLYQHYDNKSAFGHVVMRTGTNSAGEPLISYGQGSIGYYKKGNEDDLRFGENYANDPEYTPISLVKKNVRMYDGEWGNRFRFVGTPEQRQWLEARNAEVRANAPTTQKAQPQPVSVQQPSAQQALKGASNTLSGILQRQQQRRTT